MFVCKRCGMKDESGNADIHYGHCDRCSEEMAEGIAAGIYAMED